MSAKEIDPEILRQRLRYDPETGKLFWRERAVDQFTTTLVPAKDKCAQWNGKFAGKEAFTCRNGDGYATSHFDGRHYKAHRVIWAIVTGKWPVGIDHENGIADDNRWVNLSEKCQAENNRNARRRKDNSSGRTGVHYRDGVWIAAIGKRRIGRFQSFQAACEARGIAEKQEGYHANHGR